MTEHEDRPWTKLIGLPVWRTTDNRVVILTRSLYRIPLHAWYVIEIQQFHPDEIEGTLMTPPFEVFGPFITQEEATAIIVSLLD
jgi:hypothetical protein